MILLEEKHDGYYVLLDDFKNFINTYNFGISNIQFGKVLTKKGIYI
jgi:hypothetical protein